ncbi:amino acid ABC transporter ATP-binding protein [Aeromicrobium tamlense]|uniref:ABC-type polar-amino-acid transporter n=1 Tax=Aeromicrobium tamlense TaxID=375541 RepID=A0A8I0G052_9ACTN|nr:amino acid ABC transporter ATP-binding protein [Aeromicrobium tamlense]MBD1270761.1 amino acid ABC transporter ATP-binding protein [Aeromicrobium tamlense]MBD1271107.1 amino acid ABC transporter ATP-binding protein [Aeromicrobium tamlense]NYI38153.1 polar amino acid transport system ATP-binding protein [Aeromicrobium tamlense]
MSEEASAQKAGRPVISVRDLVKRYGDHTVLTGVSLDVQAGEVVAIIGPSGGGKSTFLRCMNYLEEPSKGTIAIDGVPIAANPPRATKAELLAVRRRIGMVFQSFNLFPHMTVLKNVTMAQRLVLGRSEDEAHERAVSLLDRVGVASKADALPSQCSGGQQQRVAIARALALKPVAMLFDEPTSALDPEVGVEVLSVMRELAADGMTMAVVTHELGFARNVADRVLLLADGEIVEQGTPDQVLTHPTHERTIRFLSAVMDR